MAEHCNVDCEKIQQILEDLASALDGLQEQAANSEPLAKATLPCARAALIVAKVLADCCGADDNGNGDDNG